MAVLKLKPGSKRHAVGKRLGPYSRPHVLSQVDGRCRVGKTIREFAADLARHIGGNPTPAQRVLIREASIKNARIGLMVDQILDGGELGDDLASRQYLAWSNSLRRDLEALGLKAPEQKQPELGQFLAARRPGRQPKVAA